MNVALRFITWLAIGGLLLGVIYYFLPIIPLPPQVEEAIKWAFSTLWEFDFIFPVRTILYAVSIFMTYNIIIITIKTIVFLYRIVVGTNSSE